MNRILLVSNSFVAKEGLNNLFKNEFGVKEVIERGSINELKNKDFIKVDLIFIDFIDNSYEKIIKMLRYKSLEKQNFKIVILDKKQNKDSFLKFMNLDIDGYIIDLDNKEELIYKIKKVMLGKKYYDTDSMAKIVKEGYIKGEGLLSRREKEVLKEVQHGYKNREIGDLLGISELTVKRHVTNILSKLELSKREDIINGMKI